jgi:hypothetical protein
MTLHWVHYHRSVRIAQHGRITQRQQHILTCNREKTKSVKLGESLCYKPEGRGLDSRRSRWIPSLNWPKSSSSITALGSTQASDRNGESSIPRELLCAFIPSHDRKHRTPCNSHQSNLADGIPSSSIKLSGSFQYPLPRATGVLKMHQ